MDKKNENTLNITSFNCRRIRNARTNISQWLKDSYKGIVLLQETHSCKTDEYNGEYNARGVAILIPDYLTKNIQINNSRIDHEGRYIFLEGSIFNTEIIFINLYSATKDKLRAQEFFYIELRDILEL